MRRFFVTYGDEKFSAAKEKLAESAHLTGEFDVIITCGYNELSEELKASDVMRVTRGGGLWSWKPDVIWTTMQKAKDGDIIVYSDSGCTINKCNEWSFYWNKLKEYDIIAQRIPKRNDKWTRKEVLEEFENNFKKWEKCYQYEATVIFLKVSVFSRFFISEWRNYMINKPRLVMDVLPDERNIQHHSFIENRHDQTIFSALVYRFYTYPNYKNKIYTCWERIEDCRLLYKQAIRATRLRRGEKEPRKKLVKRVYKRAIKHYILIPFIYAPLQWWYCK